MFHVLNYLTRLRFNLKPNLNIDLQKIKSLPEDRNSICFCKRSTDYFRIRFATKVTNALTKLINLDDSQISDDSAFTVSNNYPSETKKIYSSIFFNILQI